MKRYGGQHVPEAVGLWVLQVYAGRDPLTGKKVWKSRTVRGTKRGRVESFGLPPPSPSNDRSRRSDSVESVPHCSEDESLIRSRHRNR